MQKYLLLIASVLFLATCGQESTSSTPSVLSLYEVDELNGDVVDQKKIDIAVAIYSLEVEEAKRGGQLRGEAWQTSNIVSYIRHRAMRCAYRALNEAEADAFFAKIMLPTDTIINVGDGFLNMGPSNDQRGDFEQGLREPYDVDYQSAFDIDVFAVRKAETGALTSKGLYVCGQ